MLISGAWKPFIQWLEKNVYIECSMWNMRLGQYLYYYFVKVTNGHHSIVVIIVHCLVTLVTSSWAFMN